MNQKNNELINLEEIASLDDLLSGNVRKQLNQIDKFRNKSKDLLSTKCELKTKKRFILNVPGIDSFMVANINEMPEFKKNWFGGTALKCKGDLKVTYLSPVSPSSVQQLTELIKKHKKFEIVFKQIDEIGTVIGQQTFKKCKLNGFRISNHSYDSNEFEKVLATFKCKSVSIDF